MLEVRNLECARGDRTLFSDLSFTLEPGQLLHLTGANGSGKTTLLRSICGLTQPRAGEIHWQGTNINDLREDYYRELAYIGHLNGINGELSALENLRYHATIWSAQHDHDFDRTLEQFGLARIAHLPTKVLSQGQKRRMALARLMHNTAPLWILDEPLTALDVATVEFMHQHLDAHVNNGGMVILTSHQALLLDAGMVRTVELI